MVALKERPAKETNNRKSSAAESRNFSTCRDSYQSEGTYGKKR